MSTAIEFNHISKQYKLGLVSTKTLSHDLNRWWVINVLHKEDPYLKIGSVNDRSSKADSDYVWALKDIDFKVEQGDVIGIIGKNGAGKSTLLKLLSRVTTPTTGTIKAKGRIASLLEVGTGFHPEMTGRENIYMNGSIMGMTKPEISRKLDEIVDFSGCERYIDTPVKRYSSGMMVRLGFAVAAHMDPEILVVDEVLAVGDAEFQKKAIGKMQDVSKGEGRTVLFVSHNMTSIRALCHNGVLLNNGMVAKTGEINDIVDTYLSFSHNKSEISVSERTDRKGSQLAKFSEVFLTVDNQKQSDFFINQSIQFNFYIQALEDIDGIIMTYSIFDAQGMRIHSSNSSQYSQEKIKLHKGLNKIYTSYSYFPLNIGTYYMNVRITDLNENDLDWVESALSFTIIEDDLNGTGKFGIDNSIVVLPHTWDYDK